MMKNIIKYGFGFVVMVTMGLTSCSDFTPTMTPDVPDLPTVVNLSQSVDNRVVTISWQYPSTGLEIDGANLTINNNNDNIIMLDNGVTSYSIKGQPMQDEYMYTVKVRYKNPNGGTYVSEGKSVIATVPYEQLADVTGLQISNIEGKSVSFSYTLPNASGITGIRVSIDGSESGTVFNEDYEKGVTLKGQPTGQDLRYRVQVVYDEAYYSDGVEVNTRLPEIETRTAFLLLESSAADLPDDDEKAAAAWYYDNWVATDKGDFITPDQLIAMTTEDFDMYGVIWIMVDRVGLEIGWQNLPSNLTASATVNALKDYLGNGGSIYLSNMATQMALPLGIVPENMPVNLFASGEGGAGDDIWTINPFLGWGLEDQSQHYDRSGHTVFEGIQLENLNGYGWASIPMIGPGQREDHNCFWDLNPYWNEAGNPAPNCVKWWENTTNSLVLAVWGQVGDHCIAGMVDFNPNATHGRCITNGLAAYEWNQNTGTNIYQQNIEKLTENILNYLK